MILTVEMLRAKNACASGVEAFQRAAGGDSVEISEAWCREHAAERGLDWDWAAGNLLSAPASAEYERVKAAALDERVKAPTWDEYERVKAAAFGRIYAQGETR